MAPRMISRTSCRSRVEVISVEICWMMWTSLERFARSRLRRSIVSWLRAISSRRPSDSGSSAFMRWLGGRVWPSSAAPWGLAERGSLAARFRGRHDSKDVRRPELEDSLHPDDRCDGLDLHVHHVEDRPAGLRMIEGELEIPGLERFRVDQPHRGLRIFPEITLRLVE